MNTNYLNKVYQNNGNVEVLEKIPKCATTVLDVGCGAGDNARILTDAGKIVTCLTISQSEFDLVGEFCDKVILIDVESFCRESFERFDCIICSHILEHLYDPQLVLAGLQRLLNPDGTIIIALPNMAYYKLRWKLLMGDWRMTDFGPFDKTHLHFFSYLSADDVYANTELILDSKFGGDFNIPLFYFRKLMPKSMVKFFDNYFGSVFPNLFSMQVIIVLKK